jgi:hypothetical protein
MSSRRNDQLNIAADKLTSHFLTPTLFPLTFTGERRMRGEERTTDFKIEDATVTLEMTG